MNGLRARTACIVGAAATLALACGDPPAEAGRRATFTPCEGDYECATVQVPVDYRDPDGAQIGIALLRAPARDPAARMGSVVVNPGGPGLAFVERLSTTYPVLSAGFDEATLRFDVVAFDWRGVGRSAPVTGCTDDALLERLRATDLTLKSPGSLEAVRELRQAMVSGCLAKADPEVLGAMNTENAARDLDRIREALGEEKLNYLGFSYGTWLGATYASLFPARVRAFALDSATFLEGDLEGDLRGQMQSYQVGFQRFFAHCAADAACTLRAAGAREGDPEVVAARFDALLARLEAGPGLPAGARTLSVVDAQFALADALGDGDWRKLAAELASAESGDASALLARADALTGRGPDGHYDSSIVGLLAVACLDQPLGASSLEAFQQFAQGSRAAFPRSAAKALIPWALCTEWPFARSEARAPISAPSAASMLVVGGRFDPITAYADAEALVQRLGNGSHLVTFEGDGHSVALKSACVREQITRFLIDPTRPPPRTSCPAE